MTTTNEPLLAPSLVDRARTRTVKATQNPTMWLVKGDPALGDSHGQYVVRWNIDAERYRCSCYGSAGGDHRARRTCSHVVAVILWRKGVIPEAHTTPDEAAVVSAATGTIAPTDPMFNPSNHPALPDWLTGLRSHQAEAAIEVLDHFKAGKKVVWLDAPTGSGKTLIGELVRRALNVPALYVCSGKTLQDQFAADYPYAAVLKGRGNYPTAHGPADLTANDCTQVGDSGCNWCDRPSVCPYQSARAAAAASDLAVVNTSYLLAEANGPGRFTGRGLGILDECDVLEREMMGHVEFNVTRRMLETLKLEAPKKGSHYPTLIGWIDRDLRAAVTAKVRDMTAQQSMFTGSTAMGLADVRRARQLKQLQHLYGGIDAIVRVAADERGVDGRGGWVRDNEAGPLVLKPVSIERFGENKLWRHASKWLCMSATIISPDQMAESLGVGEGEWAVVQVPMTFPVTNRPIFQIPVASMTNREKEESWPAMVDGIVKVLDQHRGERVLVHAVSYALAKYLSDELRKRGTARRIVTYANAQDREEAIRVYRAVDGAVMVASSLDRGVDFKDDDCRVVVIAKVPFPYLGDPQVSKRMHQPGGQEWYSVQTVRTIVQMTGRGVRSEKDWCTTYILDSQFGTNIYKRSKRLFPKWWREAVEFKSRREFERGD